MSGPASSQSKNHRRRPHQWRTQHEAGSGEPTGTHRYQGDSTLREPEELEDTTCPPHFGLCHQSPTPRPQERNSRESEWKGDPTMQYLIGNTRYAHPDPYSEGGTLNFNHAAMPATEHLSSCLKATNVKAPWAASWTAPLLFSILTFISLAHPLPGKPGREMGLEFQHYTEK